MVRLGEYHSPRCTPDAWTCVEKYLFVTVALIGDLFHY
jgi:hypothetical protein